MTDCLIVERLSKVGKAHIILWVKTRRYEGVVTALDNTYLEIWDSKRKYSKIVKISDIEDLEVRG